MLLRECFVVPNTEPFVPPSSTGWRNQSQMYIQRRLENRATLKHIVLSFFVLPTESYPKTGPLSPSFHAVEWCRLLPQKRKQEPCQFTPPPNSTGWGSTLGAVLPEEYPWIKSLPGWDIRIWYPTQMGTRWILQEIAVTLIWLALSAEKQPSTWAFLTAEPSVSIPWNRQQKSDLRAKKEIATA